MSDLRRQVSVLTPVVIIFFELRNELVTHLSYEPSLAHSFSCRLCARARRQEPEQLPHSKADWEEAEK
eukprot:768489-Hanusia_phi.AAC.4